MKDIFLLFLKMFFDFTGIGDRFSFVTEYEIIILPIIFGTSLVLGFYFFRFYQSVLFFCAYVYACAMVLPKIMNWQSTVAVFSVSGVFLAFLFYKCNRSGSMILCGCISGLIAYSFIPHIIPAVIFAILGIVLTFFFPVHGVCVFTSLFGGLGISSLLGFPFYVGLIAGILFAIFQIWVTKDQNIFDKKYPAAIQEALDRKKRKKVAA